MTDQQDAEQIMTLEDRAEAAEAAITAYLSVLPMPDVKGLVEDINSQIGDDPQKVFLPEALLRRCSAALTTLSAKLSAVEAENARAILSKQGDEG